MKKIIILIFLFTISLFHISLFSQSIDTAKWSLKANQSDGSFTMLTNRGTYQGKSAGTVIIPLSIDVTLIDTSVFSFVGSNVDGTFRQAKNKNTYYGKTAGTVLINLLYEINHNDTITLNTNFPFNAYGYAYKDSTTIYTAFQQLMRSIDTTDFGFSTNGSITQAGQTCKVLCNNISLNLLSHGILHITNANITGSSIPIISQPGYTTAGDIDANALVLGWIITGTGTMDILIDVTVGSGFTNPLWIAYTLN